MDGAWGGTLPVVYGHEAAGVVEEVGPGVSHVEVGDHVVVTLIRSCGECHYCAQGHHRDLRRAQCLWMPRRRSLVTTARPWSRACAAARLQNMWWWTAHRFAPFPKTFHWILPLLLACGVMTGLGAVWNTAQVPSGSNVVVIGTGRCGFFFKLRSGRCPLRRKDHHRHGSGRRQNGSSQKPSAQPTQSTPEPMMRLNRCAK